MPKSQRLILLLLATAVLAVGPLPTSAASDLPSSSLAPPLSLDQVVDNLIRRNIERAHALQSSEATRIYHLVYRGFPGEREAEMTVEARYTSPSTKDFRIISQTGSKLICERVFKRLLESEREAAGPEMQSRTLLNRSNYDFDLVGYEPASQGGQYVLQVTPKAKSKYVYRGRIWVDGTDFAVTRIEAEPAQNPSFWTKKSEIHHEYMKVQGFWLPARNQSVSYIRLGGRATLTIVYKDYKIKSTSDSNAVSALVSGLKN